MIYWERDTQRNRGRDATSLMGHLHSTTEIATNTNNVWACFESLRANRDRETRETGAVYEHLHTILYKPFLSVLESFSISVIVNTP